MFHKDYSNFVKPVISDSQQSLSIPNYKLLNGEEARKLYLEEVGVKNHESSIVCNANVRSKPTRTVKKPYKQKLDEIDTSDTSLILSAQNNDVGTLKKVLNAYPDKISTLDSFGWSLLMIACQANSVDVVKELLKRGIDKSVRDKAGNSANTLVIKNKNVVLADILLNTSISEPKSYQLTEARLKEEYKCELCNNKLFPDKQDHLSSTIHNLNASKGKKIPAKFMIPSSNVGYQIMLKEGWDNESGLGRNGSGKIYPVKAVQKLDRKGLGLSKKISRSTNEKQSTTDKSKSKGDYYNNRQFEINFRRQFY